MREWEQSRGAAASTIGVLATRGKPTEIYPESTLTFRTLSPLTVDTVTAEAAFQPVRQEDYAPAALQRRGYVQRAVPARHYYKRRPYYSYGDRYRYDPSPRYLYGPTVVIRPSPRIYRRNYYRPRVYRAPIISPRIVIGGGRSSSRGRDSYRGRDSSRGRSSFRGRGSSRGRDSNRGRDNRGRSRRGR